MKKIASISIKHLFGMFTYKIPINQDERITIIHGPNGFGKTAILRLLYDIFSGRTKALRTIPFSEFQIDFSDNTTLKIKKSTVQTTKKNRPGKISTPKITFYFTDPAGKEMDVDLRTQNSAYLSPSPSLYSALFDRFIPELDRVASDVWRVIPTAELLSFEEILERYSDRFPDDLHEIKESGWLKDVRSSIPIRFIEAQRLLNPQKLAQTNRFEVQQAMVSTVDTYAEELAEAIKTKLAESTELSQSLDSTFPSRLVNPSNRHRAITETELRKKLAQLEKKRADLMESGLMDQDNKNTVQILEQDELDPGTMSVLSVYVDDTEQKLGVFDEIAEKIDLLKTIINKRFLYKEMVISRKDGFVFKTPNGENLSPTDLSSGEQHELVLFYELLFKVAPGSLILIDEPELSLHIIWQEHFLKDVQDITRLSNIDVLIATHSPDIISSRRDLVVELEDPK